MIDVRCCTLGLATVCLRRIGGGENTGYDSSGLCARGFSSEDGGDSKEIRRGSKYASKETVMSADDGDGGPPWELVGRAGKGISMVVGGPRSGEGGAEVSLVGVWNPRGEAGLSGVWYPRPDASESPRTSGTCSDSPGCVVHSSSSSG